MATTGAEIATLARALQAETARLGFQPPAFRASLSTKHPRALRRFELATVVVIRLGRELRETTGDMIEGVIAAQRPSLEADAAGILRNALWQAAGTVAA